MQKSLERIEKNSFINEDESQPEKPVEELSFGDREKRRAEEKRKKLEESKRIQKEKEKEEKERQDREKSIVAFQYYIDFGTLTVLGSVFFVTCIVGFLFGVSSKSLSIRAVVSVAFASIVVYVLRKIAKNYFNKELERKLKKVGSDKEQNEKNLKNIDKNSLNEEDVEK